MRNVAIETFFRENWKRVSFNVGFATLYSFFATVVFMVYLHEIWYFLAIANAIVLGYFGAIQQASVFKIERITWVIVSKYSIFTFILMLTPEVVKTIGAHVIAANWILYVVTVTLTTVLYYLIIPKFASFFIGKDAVKTKYTEKSLLFHSTLFLAVFMFLTVTETLKFSFIAFNFSNIVLWWINFLGCLLQSLFFVIGHSFVALYYNSNSTRHNKG
jgi:hypothetical protein